MNKLKIVIIADWFSDNMGYAENFLPKALSKLGHDVHLVTSVAQVYYNSPLYNKTYEPFLGPNIVKEGISQMDGYTLHRLPLKSNRSSLLAIKGLLRYLGRLKPQIIQTFTIDSLSTYEAAKYCRKNDCKLFTESHLHASVFHTSVSKTKNILKTILRKFRAYSKTSRLKFVDSMTQVCYPIAPDVARIATDYFFTSKNKIKIQSLGVDTNLFHPANNLFSKAERDKFREQLDIKVDSLLCIYTGRFTRDKKPQCLARAVDYLQNSGENIEALFIGNGKKDEIEEIGTMRGCIVHKFVQVKDLPKFYWISDIGVWPSQESTSQLDAAACGLPLILSNHIEVKERMKGNGLLYKENNEVDLAEKIRLLKDTELRRKMSIIGAEKVRYKFSWKTIAEERISDYSRALLK